MAQTLTKNLNQKLKIVDPKNRTFGFLGKNFNLSSKYSVQGCKYTPVDTVRYSNYSTISTEVQSFSFRSFVFDSNDLSSISLSCSIKVCITDECSLPPTETDCTGNYSSQQGVAFQCSRGMTISKVAKIKPFSIEPQNNAKKHHLNFPEL